MPKLALSSCVPWMIAGDRRYFWPLESQASSGFDGSSTCLSASAQENAENFAELTWSGLRVHLSMSCTDDLSVGTGTLPGCAVGRVLGSVVGWSLGEALLLFLFFPALSAMSRPLDRARPAGDAVSDGFALP